MNKGFIRYLKININRKEGIKNDQTAMIKHYIKSACSITGLSAGTYTLIATRYGCTAIVYNVYHPGSGITTVYFGPTSPEINCEE
ncbi:MAG: hypothetical protein IPM38_10585 [Ignavibacteria bacterium]|nr:hypothetical protein [Ignavibacteria bacterium]